MRRLRSAIRLFAGACCGAAALLHADLCRAAASAPPAPEAKPLVIHRTGTELVQLLVNLGIFWIVAGGVFVALLLMIREADRTSRLGGR